MTLFKSSSRGAATWITLRSGAQATESREVIVQILSWLVASRELLTLASKGYQSPRTILVGFDEVSLEFDLPLDWPPAQQSIQVLFRDEAMVWNQLRVRVLRVEGDSLFTEFPVRLQRLQRRANYRVIAPLGSTAAFRCEHGEYHGMQVVDISANGVMVCVDHPCPLDTGDQLLDVELYFPGLSPGSAGHLFIRRARVMRTDQQDNIKYFYGIRFTLERQEEEQLLHYVRQRELELLRKSARG